MKVTRTTTTGFDAGRGLSYAKIEGFARHVRSVLGLSPTNSVPGVGLFESLRKYTTSTMDNLAFRLDYAIQDLPDGIEAETRWERASRKVVVTLSPETYISLEDEYPRARFCLCHEIGHAVCHCDLLVKLSGIPHGEATLMRAVTTHERFRDTEWQANAFAGALLMPAEGLLRLQLEEGGMLSAGALQRVYGVSRESAAIRLELWGARQYDLLPNGGARNR